MEEKIKSYVDYQFRFDKRDDLEELKKEITGNLMDRYHEYLNSGKNEEEAYIEAIKSMGDFSNNELNQIPEEYSIKPSIPDILLISGFILSIFGLIITMMSAITGAIITAISILLFSGSAYYLYSYSQYVRKEYMDIEKHHILLQKIFKYMKSSFIFWALSLSFVLASLLMGTITKLIVLDPRKINFDSLQTYVITYIVFFIIALIIFMIIFSIIYNRLMDQYYYLTGESSLKGKIKEGVEFLYRNSKRIHEPLILNKRFMPTLILLMFIPHLFLYSSYKRYDIIDGNYYQTGGGNGMFFSIILSLFNNRGWGFLAFIPLVTLIYFIFIVVLFYKQKVSEVTLIITYYIWLLSVLTFISLFNQQSTTTFNNIVPGYSMLMLFLLTILLVVRGIIKTRFKKQKDV